ncbi:hypothetical protein GUJ93_ZPchr0136g33667 [Zizania palustris]|uniref:2-C-methyl-D-erythritol 2,4-cyclodiphosphate synthase domain-containing protein n=1 Tax=Zizania palustris TaxID=103762 RepID=A0A8J5RD15_ZIZPA|nr:hypothetical protein GUJ93_ZPchr0136g33667 [Zizania palustris]
MYSGLTRAEKDPNCLGPCAISRQRHGHRLLSLPRLPRRHGAESRRPADPSAASPVLPSLRLRRSSPVVAAAVQAEHQPAVAAAPKPPALPFRVGHGFDLHRLEPDLPLIIGGITSRTTRGCDAHSDGDVLLHCVVDAILGALGLPDIGQIFPDSTPAGRAPIRRSS